MVRLIVFTVALALGTLAVGVSVQMSFAQAGPEVHEACKGSGGEIRAADLPRRVEPGTCPASGQVIVDNGVGSIVPDPGEGVHVEGIGPAGVQELGIERHRDGTLELMSVGDESGGTWKPSAVAGPAPCSDRAFADQDTRLESDLPWYFKRSSTPGEVTRDDAEKAIRRAGTNVISARNECGLEDNVPVGLPYQGNTDSAADMDADGICTGNDGMSEVSFGWLPDPRLAQECKSYVINGSGYDRVRTSDIKINKRNFEWTTRPEARSCRGSHDLQGVMTHERGHTFGLGHVSEKDHGKLTMSPNIGPCQQSERTLGRGDVLGLNGKYQ